MERICPIELADWYEVIHTAGCGPWRVRIKLSEHDWVVASGSERNHALHHVNDGVSTCSRLRAGIHEELLLLELQLHIAGMRCAGSINAILLANTSASDVSIT